MKRFIYLIEVGFLLSIYGCTDNRGLVSAVEFNDAIKVQQYLEKGVSPNQRDSLDRPLLIIAIKNKNTEIVQLLLSHGAAPNINFSGMPAIFLAVETSKCSEPILKSLIDAGADVNAISPFSDFTPLLRAARMGGDSCFELLVKSGADLNAIDSIKSNVVTSAALGGHVSILSQLISLDVNFNSVMSGGISALMLSVATGDADFTMLLLNSGKVNACLTSDRGLTAKDIALKEGYVDLAQLLPDCN